MTNEASSESGAAAAMVAIVTGLLLASLLLVRCNQLQQSQPLLFQEQEAVEETGEWEY